MVLVWALVPAAAHAVTAPPSGEPAEIPRPSRAWTPAGYNPAPEAQQLEQLMRAGLAPQAVPGLTPAQRSLGEGPRDARLSNARQALAALRARPGMSAEAVWDERLGTAHRVRASGLSVGRGFDLKTAGGAEAAARAFVRDHADLLTGGEAPSPADMPLVAAHRVGALWLLVFGQRWHGLEVLDGRVDVRLRQDGSVPLFGSSWYAAASAASDQPGVQASAAMGVARASLGRSVRDLGSDLALLPVDGAAGIDFRLVYRVHQKSDAPPGQWTTYVDAADSRVWARESDLRYVDVSGTVTGSILPYTYTDPFVTANLKQAVVWRAADSTFAATNGSYTLTGAAPGESLWTAFRSSFLEVVNNAGRNSRLGGVAPGPVNFNWAPATSDTAERNVFFQALQAHAYIKALDPGFTGLDYRVPANINIPATCNAFWDGQSINFYSYGGGCPNTGDIADVIFHEYGHGITQFTWAPNGPNGAMHEGLSDYYAATMTRNSHIGVNFRGPGTFLRNTQNTVALPANSCNGEVHCVGNAVSGALWDMQSNLIAALADSNAGRAKADSLFHYAGYGGAFWFDDYLLDVLAVADNDGTLLNGTPFFGQICSAFTAHGFVCPDTTSGPWITHTPLPDSDPTASPFTVTANLGSFAGALAAGGQSIHYRYNGGLWDTAPLNPVSGTQYQGQIPAPPGGGRVDYYLDNRDAGGLRATLPKNAPTSFFTFYIGTLSTVFADDMEIDRGWTPTTSASTGRWQRVDPNGTSDTGFFFQTEDDHTPGAGVFCWVTGDTTAGLDPGVDDIDGGCVQLVSPRWDLSAANNARLSFWRWYTDETAYDDTLHFDVSSDDGATWTPLSQIEFTHNDWEQDSFDLGSVIPLTSQVRMRVRACDRAGGSLVEAALDDVLLTSRVFSLVAVGPPGASSGPLRLALESPYPLPSAGPTTVFFTVPGNAGAPVRASLRLYDARGRLVRTLRDGELPAGRTSVTWDGLDGSGRRAVAGAYLLRFEAGGQWASEKLVLTR
ncbi:MAG TPA: FlgD immunoglobulin-like domain containing protein [Candidatus Eisenbacteria bacterium]|nr:FlgD immunoglobulin-like domain containing protein [Candidatus Eisenbacteria bacterium]